MPSLPKNRIETQEAIGQVDIKSSKSESMLSVNDRESEIVIISTTTNLQYLCNEVKDVFIDGNLYLRFCRRRLNNAVVICGRSYYNVVMKSLNLQPDIIHIDFERAMHNAVTSLFPDTRIDCCRFHLGQSWGRKIQGLGLSRLYKDKSTEEGKWLSKFFGLSFLEPQEVEDCFTEDIMADTPKNEKCSQFADYVLDGYIMPTASYPPNLWASVPKMLEKRTNNGPESFHTHFNSQFYARHPNIFIFLDVIQKLKTATNVKMCSSASLRRNGMERLQFLIDKYNEYGNISRLEYIKCLG